MQIEFTVADRGRARDVLVTAPASVALAELVPALGAALGSGVGSTFWCDGRPLDVSTTLDESCIRQGCVLVAGGTADAAPRPGPVSLQVVGGPSAGAIMPIDRGRIEIGRDPGCDLILNDPDVSRRHAAVTVEATAITLHDLGSTNGTRVDSRPVGAGGVPLRPGSLIALGDSQLALAGPLGAPATVRRGAAGTDLVLLPPRVPVCVPDREIALPSPRESPHARGIQWISALLPAVAGSAVAWIAHSPQFLLFALLSPLMLVSTAFGDRVHWRRSRRREAAGFRRRRAAAESEIAAALAHESVCRRRAAPDPASILCHVRLPSARLWERRRADADHLSVRLGTADRPSVLRVRCGSAATSAGTLTAVPYGVDLRLGPLGIAGPRAVVTNTARFVIGQLAALHSPADVEFALLLAPDAAADWEWARWLPHLGGRVAVDEREWTDLVAELADRIAARAPAIGPGPDVWQGPWFVVVVDGASRLGTTPGLPGLLARGSARGLTALCLDADVAALPGSCAGVAHADGVTGTRLRIRHRAGPAEIVAVVDQVSVDWAEQVARGLAPLVDAGGRDGTAPPTTCSLLQGFGLTSLDPGVLVDRWTASAGGARAALGLGTDGGVEIDLRTDGPHALVAGTTGAGKSMLLQTLIAGLAVNHPPEELHFLLIDYKGGAAFADCARLPHTAGLVTDLDPYLTERALRSLNAELRRRERLFAQAGAVDLESYRRTCSDEPVPRLVLVIDEFAALADELPDFVSGLVAIAQRGRSLGIHLVLATQRPGGTVSAEIRANTSLRIALRVTDPADSIDVIDTADAAFIDRSCAGRAYLRTGSALTCFQSAHAGSVSAPDADSVRVEVLGSWRRRQTHDDAGPSATDLTRVVDAVREAAARCGQPPARTPWLPPLPSSLPRGALEPGASPDSIPFARVDLPDEQRTATSVFDLRTGSLLTVGAGRSGRTQLLVSLAAGAAGEHPPNRLHVYVVDPVGELAAALSPLPHCATVLRGDDLDLAPRLLSRLERECARRARAAHHGHAGPRDDSRMLLLVDGWDILASTQDDLDRLTSAETLANLLRIGPAAGLSVAVTGDRSVLAPRFAGAFGTRILLRLAERADYALAGIGARDVPVRMPPGRAVRAGDGAVLQVAHAGVPATPNGARDRLAAVAARWSSVPGVELGSDAIRIRPLPPTVGLDELSPAPPGQLSIGVGGDRLDPLHFDPFTGPARLLVAGPPRSGRSTLLRSLARQANAAGLATLVAAPGRSPLAEEADRCAMRIIRPLDAEVGEVPAHRTLLLVDDSEAFADTPAGDRLASWLRMSEAPLAAVVAGRPDSLATTYRGIAAEARHSRCGVLLRPGPIDGELLGVRLARRARGGPPGRGIAVGEASWGTAFDDGRPVPVQVAAP